MDVVRCTCRKDKAGCKVPHGRWVVIGQPAGRRYPCLCRPGRACSPIWCPCAGRADKVLPAACCARINTPAVVVAAKAEYDRARRARG